MPRDVEFVEDAVDSGPAAATRRPSRWWLLVVAALVLGAVAFAVSRPATQAPRAAASSPSSSPHSLAALPDHALATPAPGAGTAPCGGAPLCAVSLAVPKVLAKALHAHLTGLRELRVETSLAQSLSTGAVYLADRVIYIRDPRYLMKISVHRIVGAAPDPEAAALGVVRVRLLTGAFVIDVLSYPSDRAPLSTATLRALAADARLEVV